MCGAKCYAIVTIVLAVLLFLLTAWFWYYLDLGVQADAIILMVIAVIGIVAVVLKKLGLLLYFIIVTAVMALFQLIQLIIVIYSADHCEEEKNPFTFICKISAETAAWAYWFPTIWIFAVMVLCAVFGFLLRRAWMQEEEGTENYY